jgi:hypothetical protein
MKRIIAMLGCLLIILLLGSVSFAQTVLTDVWKDKEYASTAKKIAVFCLVQDRARRIIIEDDFMRQLKARGVDSVPGYIIIPPDKMVDNKTALTKIRDLGANAILTIRLIDRLTAQTQIPEPGKKDSKESSRWSNYYRYVYDTQTRNKDEPAYLETILFDAVTEQRVWTARSVTKVDVVNPELITNNIKFIIDQLASDKMIQ